MHELVINLHLHTLYSDGGGTHQDIAEAALRVGLDGVIVTDHNVLVRGPQGYYKKGKKRMILLIGEEIHDQTRRPERNHLLAFGIERELATLAEDQQNLINAVRQAGGLSFLAHPHEMSAPSFNEGEISWSNWDVKNYTGIELWNNFSEFKTRLRSKIHGIFYAFFPKFIGHGPHPETLKKWDELTESGQRVVAIGGSDAHNTHRSLGPLRKLIFPYEYHFSAINTHILTPHSLGDDFNSDERMIFDAFAAGHAFVGYDLPASTLGFRFSAQGKEKSAIMGDEIPAKGGVTLQIRLPKNAECHLLKNGEIIRKWENQTACAHITTEAGIYRVEVFHLYRGRKRAWIFSNPIYVRS